MKLKLIIIAAVAAITAASCGTPKQISSAAEKQQTVTMRLGTYNLWRSDLGKDEYSWKFRKDILAQSIVDNAFDIFAGEEVDTTMYRELPTLVKEKGGNYEWFTFSPYDPEGKGSVKAQAVIYNPTRFKMVEDHHFWFSDTPEVMSSGWDEMKFKRGGCCFVFEDLGSHRKFFLMVSHMPLGPQANEHAASIINEMAARYNTDNLPAFFVGDLNTREERPSSRILRTVWTDAFLTDVPKEGPKGTFNSKGNNKDMDAAPRIDFIYFRGEGITPLKYVVNPAKYGEIYPSDHCPVYVDFQF